MRRLLPVLCLLLVLAAPAAAPAASGPLVGISENQPQMFDHPGFAELGARKVRLVTAWNVLTRAGDDERDRVGAYLRAAQARGIEVLVTFEHARGAADVCKVKANHTALPQCQLPTVAEYEANFKLFRATYPWVRTYAPWNEINHFTQPTARDPKRAAAFTNVAARNCAGCTIVVADILDQADSAKARTPKFKATTRYIKTFRKSLKVPRKVCGIHNYSDTNRFRTAGTAAIIKALGCKQIWLTETGGIAAFGSFKFDLGRQLKATRYMFTSARRFKQIKRLYVYTYFGGHTPRFDAGLVSATGLRPAYAEVKKRMRP